MELVDQLHWYCIETTAHETSYRSIYVVKRVQKYLPKYLFYPADRERVERHFFCSHVLKDIFGTCFDSRVFFDSLFTRMSCKTNVRFCGEGEYNSESAEYANINLHAGSGTFSFPTGFCDSFLIIIIAQSTMVALQRDI